MKVKKVMAAGTMAAVFASSILHVSAVEATSGAYAKALKESGKADLIIDVEAYKAAYKDLEAAFGDNADAYIEHYLTYGIYEGRMEGVLFDPLAYAEAYDDIKGAFGEDILAIVDHYVTFGVEENRTEGTANGYADMAEALKNGAQGAVVTGNSRSVSYGSGAAAVSMGSATVGSDRQFHHTTSIYANDGSTLLRVEYYDENNKLSEYSAVTNFNSSTNSYTENIYVYDEERRESVLKRTDTYVNGVLVSSQNY